MVTSTPAVQEIYSCQADTASVSAAREDNDDGQKRDHVKLAGIARNIAGLAPEQRRHPGRKPAPASCLA